MRGASKCVTRLVATGLCVSGGAHDLNPKMWEFEVLMRDSEMSGVFAGYSRKKRDGW